MPYIRQVGRQVFDEHLDLMHYPRTKGELEYCIFKLMKMYMSEKEYSYANLHDTVYAAAHCADEFRRRYLDTREDEAMIENGDIKVSDPEGTIYGTSNIRRK